MKYIPVPMLTPHVGPDLPGGQLYASLEEASSVSPLPPDVFPHDVEDGNPCWLEGR